MKIVDRTYIESHRDEIMRAIKNGSIFIYPTDTIYGVGCDATNSDAVKRIREFKVRSEKPFSIIVPNKEWILEHCVVSDPEELDILPGPYTFILRRKGKSVVSPEINPKDKETIGVRIPAHWFTDVLAEAGVPFVTTSVNISGEKYMEYIEAVPAEILKEVDYVVYEGEKKGRPSEKIDLTSE